MDLRSNSPYWLLRDGVQNIYPSLDKDVHADVTVMGAGITGALIAYHLCKAGFSVNVVDKRHVGFGSTAACTGLLQYEIDTPLHELITRIGSRNAVRSYQLCLDALNALKKLNQTVKKKTGYMQVPSLQYASFISHTKTLRKEFDTRKKNSIAAVDWLEASDVRKLFGFEAPGAILSAEGATIDAYAFTHSLLTRSIKTGVVQVYDKTPVQSIEHMQRNVRLTTEAGNKLTSRYLLIACGYESQKYLSRQVEISSSTYALVSEPSDNNLSWYNNAMIWETANPYLYMSKTADNRIQVGGKDDKFYDPEKRDARIPRKSKALLDSFSKLFPSSRLKADFAWAGYFGQTKDGLPYIGSVAERPRTYFALGFAGNGVVFSVIAARMITDMLSGKKDKDFEVFSFER